MIPAAQESEALDFISALIYDRCRIRLGQGKHPLIKARLGKRLRHHGIPSIPEYCHFLRSPAGEEELACVVDALTTNFTHFMREPDHFDFLLQTIVPAFAGRGGGPFQVWSAACSSGEEPYTIAFHLAEHARAVPAFDWRVAASDVSTRVLEKARAAVYDEERLASLPREWLPRYFQKGVGKWAGHFRVKRAIAERVGIEQINLIEDYSHSRPFHAIFCRNVMIYFDRETQQSLVARLSRFLVSGGYLIVGHSESLNGLQVPLRCLRPSIYRKE